MASKLTLKQRHPQIFHYAWVILFVTMVVTAVLNAIFTYASSLFINPMMEAFGCGSGTLQYRMTVHSLVVIAMMAVLPKLYQKFNFKLLLIIGIICYTGAFIGFSYCQNVAQYIVLGALQGVGSALALFIPGSYLINAWFKKFNGLAFALMAIPTTLIATFTTPWVQSLITERGWRYVFRMPAIGCMILGVAVVALLCVKDPQEKGLLPLGDTGKPDAATGSASERNVLRGVTCKAAKKSTAFWAFFFISFAIQAFQRIATFLSPAAVSNGLSAEAASYVVSAYSLGSAVAGLIMGVLFDKLGIKISSYLFGVVNILAMLLFVLGGSNFVLLCAGAFLYSFFGMNYTIQLGTKEVFGMLEWSSIFALLTASKNVALVVVPVLFGYIFDWTGSYNLMFIIGAVLILASMLCVSIIYRHKDELPISEKLVESSAKSH